jgi:hypothetical protein
MLMQAAAIAIARLLYRCCLYCAGEVDNLPQCDSEVMAGTVTCQ